MGDSEGDGRGAPAARGGQRVEPVRMTSADPFGQRDVRRAYDTVAEDYAALLPDTRAEAPLDLTMVDAFAAAVSADDDPSVRGHREGRAGVPPRPPSIGP